MIRAVLSLGANLGDRVASLRAAVADLGDAVVAVSPVYETPPWGDEEQQPYLNAAVLVEARTEDPHHWLVQARRIEASAGRLRDPSRRYAPRTLDADVVVVYGADGDLVLSDHPELTLPHPRAHLRAFVLRPWLDIEPDPVLPGYGRVLALLESDGVKSDLVRFRRCRDVALRPLKPETMGVEPQQIPGSP